MSFTPPNQSITGQHVGHSSSTPKGSPADGDGTGRNHAHPGRVDPPNGNALRSNIGRSGQPTSTIGDGRVKPGSVPVGPMGSVGQTRGPARSDDASQARRGK